MNGRFLFLELQKSFTERRIIKTTSTTILAVDGMGHLPNFQPRWSN
jgi:hypothetical protein